MCPVIDVMRVNNKTRYGMFEYTGKMQTPFE